MMQKENEKAYFCVCKEILAKAKKRPNVLSVFHVIQAAIAFKIQYVDYPKISTEMGLAPDIGTIYSLEKNDMKLLEPLYDIELVDEGGTDYHTYKFSRKILPAETTVWLKTFPDPTL